MIFNVITLYAVALLPILFFVLVLFWLDSFAIVKKRYIFLAFLWGVCSIFLAPYMFYFFRHVTPWSLLITPISEEFLKGLGILFLIQTKRAVFIIDSILYGAAIGAGFAFTENIFYVNAISDMTIGTAIMRGVGTAIMHCGAVAGTAAILNFLSFHNKNILLYYILTLIPAIALHSIYNALLLPPAVMLVVITMGVALWMFVMIVYNERSIGRWLDMEMNSEVKLLKEIQQGHFSNSKAGQYMLTISKKFTPEKLFDMYCYIQIYLEISLVSKRNIMLQEIGMDIPFDKSVESKIAEFKTLKKQIGKTGELALSPIIKQNRLIKWKISTAKKVS